MACENRTADEAHNQKMKRRILFVVCSAGSVYYYSTVTFRMPGDPSCKGGERFPMRVSTNHGFQICVYYSLGNEAAIVVLGCEAFVGVKCKAAPCLRTLRVREMYLFYEHPIREILNVVN